MHAARHSIILSLFCANCVRNYGVHSRARNTNSFGGFRMSVLLVCADHGNRMPLMGRLRGKAGIPSLEECVGKVFPVLGPESFIGFRKET